MLALACLAVFDLAVVPQAPAGPANTFRNVGGFDSIRTDDIQYSLTSGAFTLKDAFTATRAGTVITADRATGNANSQQFHAEGHVVVHESKGATASVAAAEHPSTLTCDVLDVDGKTRVSIARGRLHFTQPGGRSATADRGTLNDRTHKIHLEGAVHIVEADRLLDADDVVYDTVGGDVEAHGNVTIRAPGPTPGPVLPKPSAAPKRRNHPF